GFLHVEILDTHLALVEGIRDRGLEHLLHDARAELRRELQRGLRLLDRLTADELEHRVALARRDPDVTLNGFGLHVRPAFRAPRSSRPRAGRVRGTRAWARTLRACAR